MMTVAAATAPSSSSSGIFIQQQWQRRLLPLPHPSSLCLVHHRPPMFTAASSLFALPRSLLPSSPVTTTFFRSHRSPPTASSLFPSLFPVHHCLVPLSPLPSSLFTTALLQPLPCSPLPLHCCLSI
ncbi:hypothetical protein BHM03_00037346 [Ensete ventricosum]|nr:hypothetical protein BHM03_00037346 [Ensete ventricosum]